MQEEFKSLRAMHKREFKAFAHEVRESKRKVLQKIDEMIGNSNINVIDSTQPVAKKSPPFCDSPSSSSASYSVFDKKPSPPGVIDISESPIPILPNPEKKSSKASYHKRTALTNLVPEPNGPPITGHLPTKVAQLYREHILLKLDSYKNAKGKEQNWTNNIVSPQ